MNTTWEPLLNTQEIAAYLNVKVSWVYDNRDDLPLVRIGRSLRARRCDLEAFVEAQQEHRRYRVA